MAYESEFLIVGAGIIGLTLARELIQRGADKVLILEKEADVGMHASGRNSGVLHAGIYYPPHTLKAQLCLKGNLLLQDYCIQKKLPIRQCGKVIVVQEEPQLSMLFQLYQRAKENGAMVEMLDEKELANIEPCAKTFQQAMYSHYTAVVDNKKILAALKQDLLESKRVTLLLNTELKSVVGETTACTVQGKIRYKQLINTAGAYADKVAHLFDVGKEYCLVPFKGIYQKLIADKTSLVNGNIYPVPNLNHPFLGVHFTKNILGDVYVGPTAIPAFGRENYGFLSGINQEALKILYHEILLYCCHPEFRQSALAEFKKYSAKYFYHDAKKLVKELQPEWLVGTPKSGIRPQLIDIRHKKMIMDFVVIQEKHSLHVLNAISPAFTSSMAFAKYIIETYFKL